MNFRDYDAEALRAVSRGQGSRPEWPGAQSAQPSSARRSKMLHYVSSKWKTSERSARQPGCCFSVSALRKKGTEARTERTALVIYERVDSVWMCAGREDKKKLGTDKKNDYALQTFYATLLLRSRHNEKDVWSLALQGNTDACFKILSNEISLRCCRYRWTRQ